MSNDNELGSPSLAPTSPNMPPGRPPLSRTGSSLSGLVGRRVGEEWSEGLFMLDMVETFFDSRLDLWERRLKEQSSKLKRRAGELLPKGIRTPGGTLMPLEDSDADATGALPGGKIRERATRHKQDLEREMRRLKVTLAERVNKLSASWATAQVVRTREKSAFVLGVCTVAFTCLMYGMAPEWLPFAYIVQTFMYLGWRVYAYKQKQFHYFLFGHLCYFVNILDLIWLLILPNSTVLFVCCYCLTFGPLASAIITWRNSLVFHSIDKVTSLFIHIYPPIVFNIILNRYENAEERYPAIAHINEYNWWQRIALSCVPYIIWQASYWKFISYDRGEKIKSGQRENSFHYLLNDKHNPIGRALRGIPAAHRELWFIFGQLIYSIIFMIPASTLFLHSERATNILLVTVFVVAAWNGASFYVEVFGRKFERELERLRKEMDALSSGQSSNVTPGLSTPGTPAAEEPVGDHLGASPLILPASTGEVAEELVLEKDDKSKTE